MKLWSNRRAQEDPFRAVIIPRAPPHGQLLGWSSGVLVSALKRRFDCDELSSCLNSTGSTRKLGVRCFSFHLTAHVLKISRMVDWKLAVLTIAYFSYFFFCLRTVTDSSRVFWGWWRSDEDMQGRWFPGLVGFNGEVRRVIENAVESACIRGERRVGMHSIAFDTNVVQVTDTGW